ncbi:MAG: S8 family peptidase [Inhella sp.]
MPVVPALRPLALLLFAAGCCGVQAQSSLEGRVIVRWKHDAPTVKTRQLRERAASDEVAELMQRRADRLSQRSATRLSAGRALDERTQVVLGVGIDSATLARRLAMDPEVELAVVDQRRYASRVPNDPIYANGAGIGPAVGQWYLKPPGNGVASSINAEAAWERTTGSPQVTVAVIDTGVRLDHPDLAGNLLPGYDMIGAGGGGSTRIAVANDGDLHDADPSDPGDWVSQADLPTLGDDCETGNSSWHGTRVAGLIGAVGNNGVGMAGVSWSGKIVPIRALGKCGGFDSDIIAAVRWAVGINPPGISVTNANPAKVVNMSLGSTGACGALYQEAFRDANARGAVVVVAAGNSAGEPVDSPANCDGALAVAGLRHIGTKVGFSSMGPEVAIAAPGGNCVNLSGACLYPMVTTTNAGVQGPTTNTYTYGNASVGTSFATPLVSGAVALLFSVDPTLTPTQVRSLLRQSARPFPTSGGGVPGETPPSNCPAPVRGTEVLECYCTTSTCGAGMLDVDAALQAMGAPVAPPQVSIQGASSGVVGESVVLSSSASASGGRSISGYQWSVISGTASLSGANSASASLSASAAGTVTVQLTVTDSGGASASSSFTVSFSAPPPAPAPGGGGGGSSSPAWLLALLLAALRLRPRR